MPEKAPTPSIIGAGIGGLSAAAYLARAGRTVIVLEQDQHLGGTASVFRRSGFTFPTGPQSFTAPESSQPPFASWGWSNS